MKEYSREEKRNLVKRTHINKEKGVDQFEGFNTEEKLITVLFQLEILNPELLIYRELNNLANKLIRDLLIEQIETTTNKGIKKIITIKGNTAVLCNKCNGSGIHYQRKDNKCDCIRGWNYNNKIKKISDAEYKEKAAKKYFKDLSKKRLLSKYDINELLSLDINEFLNITKITTF